MFADVDRIGAILTSGNAATCAPGDGRRAFGGRRSVDGIVVLFLSGCCRVNE